MKIVPMDHTHLDEMAALEQVCFTMPWSRAAIAEELSNEYAVYIVALDDAGAVAGYAGMHLAFDEAYITNVAVRPESRRQGIASELLTTLERIARENAVGRMSLEVRRSNKAAQLTYAKRGFSPIAVRKGYYSLPNEDAFIFEKLLV